ncbi:hypothetical protein [Ruminococcus sp.]|uniref:hypothetical protein n=1 Tax=Ruminococcus sp. TaxID=41978 RepID=UPI001B545513|nr:hypothetical protein [Ruminococcus sp.]MBP5431576.1 hypothetical protein [Ruminococcus sp.]
MALDRFINNVRTEVAKRCDLKTDAEIDAFFIGLEESAKDNQEFLEKRDKMLRDTVAELCEAKRLLKVMYEDIKRYAGGMCRVCTECTVDFECKCEDFCTTNKRSKWKYKYEPEILALIGEDGEQNDKTRNV